MGWMLDCEFDTKLEMMWEEEKQVGSGRWVK